MKTRALAFAAACAARACDDGRAPSECSFRSALRSYLAACTIAHGLPAAARLSVRIEERAVARYVRETRIRANRGAA
jgi:hypothetical protein